MIFFGWHLPMTLIFSVMCVTLLHPSCRSLPPAEPGQVTVLQIWLLLIDLQEPGRLHQQMEGQENFVRGQRQNLLHRGLHLRHQKSLSDWQWRVLVSVCGRPKQQWRQHHSHWYVPGKWERTGLEWMDEVNWSRAGGGVADRTVLLESPALPVPEGAAVTLRCRDKFNSSSRSFHFYRDGSKVLSSFDGLITFPHTSKSDEGLYKCSTAGGEESESSWLAVQGDASLATFFSFLIGSHLELLHFRIFFFFLRTVMHTSNGFQVHKVEFLLKEK